MAEQNLDIVIRVRGGQVASSEIKGVGKATEQVGTQTESANKKTAGLSRTLKGLASGIAVYKGYQFVKSAVAETTSLAKSTGALQRVTGFDTRTASGWVEMAKQRGIASKQLNQGFITLGKNIVNAGNGSKSANQAFSALGLDAANLKAQDAQTRMGMLADSFKALPAGVDKAALAQKLFGRQAQTLLPILNTSAKGLNEYIGGFAKSSGMTAKSKEETLKFVAAQRQWGAATDSVKVAVGTALIPILVSLAKVLTPLAEGFAKLMQQSPIFRYMVIALSAAMATFVGIMAVANITMLPITGTMGLIIAAVVGLGVALVICYKKIGWFRDAVNAMAKGAVAAFNWLKQAAVNVFNWIKGNWPLLVSILGGPLAAAAVQVALHFNQIKSAAQSVWNFLRGLGQFIGGVFAGAWRTAASAVQGVASAIGDVVSTAEKISKLPGKALKVVTGAFPGAATGGTITHGGAAVVGERGPEVVRLPTGSQVIPNHALAALGGGGGRVVVPVYLDNRQIALAQADYTADQMAAR